MHRPRRMIVSSRSENTLRSDSAFDYMLLRENVKTVCMMNENMI